MKMNKKAFSLIELSIVILIIGIIIAGITQSSRLVAEFRLANARNQTQSSPINSMDKLYMWVESTLEESFLPDEAQETGTAVTTWNDMNLQASAKNNPTQSTDDNRPFYTKECINSLPCLRFDGSNDALDFDGTGLANTNFSIIIVEQRRSSKSQNYFIAGETLSDNANLHLGYRTGTQLTFGLYANDYNINGVAGTYSTPIPRIHSFIFNSGLTIGKEHYLNGTQSTLTASGTASSTTGLVSFANAKIGSYTPGPSNYNGDIAEIIIFTKALKTNERQSIEDYLGKKWGITVVAN